MKETKLRQNLFSLNTLDSSMTSDKFSPGYEHLSSIDYGESRGKYEFTKENNLLGRNRRESKEKLKLTNLSTQNLIAPYLDKKGLKELIMLPDYSPGRGKLPTGSVAIYSSSKHTPNAQMLGPDIGCGMLLAKFKKPIKDLEYSNYKIASELRASGSELGSLGGGNHFIDFYEAMGPCDEISLKNGDQLVLIHSGSRLKGKDIFDKKLKGEEYLQEYKKAVEFGEKNRSKLAEIVEKNSENELDLVFDNIHNSIEIENDKIIYRKGAVNMKENKIGIISSRMGSKAIIVTPKSSLKKLKNSLCHGTGRKISRSEAKKRFFDSKELRGEIHIPNFIADDFIKTEAPHCYRSLEEIFPALDEYITRIGTLKNLSHI